MIYNPQLRTFLVAALAAASPTLLSAQQPEFGPAVKAYVTVSDSVVAITDVLVIDGTGGDGPAGADGPDPRRDDRRRSGRPRR